MKPFKTRGFCTWIAVVTAGLLGCCGSLSAADEPISLGTESQIFVDDELVAQKQAVVRRAHACEKLSEPVMVPRETWEQDGDDRRIYVYGTVLRDEEAGQFRLWYNRNALVVLATSVDGLQWDRPRLGICELSGSKENNVVFPHFHSPSVVCNDKAPDPDHRYQMLGCSSVSGRGYYAAHSADGLHWKLYPKNPILPNSDTCTLAFDGGTGEYLAFHKRYAKHRGEKRRLVYLATSRDMQNWSEPEMVMAPDEVDDAQVRGEGGRFAEFYNMSAFPYAGQFLGLVTHFRYSGSPDGKGPLQSPHDGPIDVQLVHSRDGRKWERCEDRSPVIPLGPHSYDAGCILGVSNGVVTVGDEMWAYYTAITTTHGGFVPEKEITIGRAAWRRDGFVSLDADDEGGVVETVALKPAGARLTVNVDASEGEFRVAVVDADGKVLPGYSAENCVPFTGDAVNHAVRWSTGFKSQKATDRLPTNQSIRLRFHMSRAKLYSYQIRD